MNETSPQCSRIVLASASPRRHELLKALVDSFEVKPADIPEPLTGDPVGDAVRLARAKAIFVAKHEPDAIVIGSDTIVHDATRSYGKPAHASDAIAMLKALSGRLHRVTTGVAVAGDGRVVLVSNTTEVELEPLSHEQIEAYVRSGRPMDKAGAYAIQDEDVPTVRAYSGCYCAIMGLPLWLTRSLLEAFGMAAEEPQKRYARCADCPDRPKK